MEFHKVDLSNNLSISPPPPPPFLQIPWKEILSALSLINFTYTLENGSFTVTGGSVNHTLRNRKVRYPSPLPLVLSLPYGLNLNKLQHFTGGAFDNFQIFVPKGYLVHCDGKTSGKMSIERFIFMAQNPETSVVEKNVDSPLFNYNDNALNPVDVVLNNFNQVSGEQRAKRARPVSCSRCINIYRFFSHVSSNHNLRWRRGRSKKRKGQRCQVPVLW